MRTSTVFLLAAVPLACGEAVLEASDEDVAQICDEIVGDCSGCNDCFSACMCQIGEPGTCTDDCFANGNDVLRTPGVGIGGEGGTGGTVAGHDPMGQDHAGDATPSDDGMEQDPDAGFVDPDAGIVDPDPDPDAARPPVRDAAPPPEPDAFTNPGDPLDEYRQRCVDQINDYRATLGLGPLRRWVDGEACTDGEAQSDSGSGTAHGTFGQCGEYAQNTCPGWPDLNSTVTGCLEMMWGEGPGGGHYENMRGSYSEVACGFYEYGGGVWASQNFR